MTKEGDLHAGEPVWYGKSVIHTCCQLDYRTAQDMIDGTIRIDEATGECIGLHLWESHRRPIGSHTKADVINDVKLLNQIAQRRRELRMGAGAFKITTKQLSFKLDPETRNPVSAGAYVIRASNKLVEEYVLCQLAFLQRDCLMRAIVEVFNSILLDVVIGLQVHAAREQLGREGAGAVRGSLCVSPQPPTA